MKRWTLTVVAMVSAFALIATPALAADKVQSQNRLQDGTCVDCPTECDPTQTQTKAQVGEAVQTQTKAQTGEAVQTQTKAQVGEPVMTQAQVGEIVRTQNMYQLGAHTPEWVQKLVRNKKQYSKQYAKHAGTIVSSD